MRREFKFDDCKWCAVTVKCRWEWNRLRCCEKNFGMMKFTFQLRICQSHGNVCSIISSGDIFQWNKKLDNLMILLIYRKSSKRLALVLKSFSWLAQKGRDCIQYYAQTYWIVMIATALSFGFSFQIDIKTTLYRPRRVIN